MEPIAPCGELTVSRLSSRKPHRPAGPNGNGSCQTESPQFAGVTAADLVRKLSPQNLAPAQRSHTSGLVWPGLRAAVSPRLSPRCAGIHRLLGRSRRWRSCQAPKPSCRSPRRSGPDRRDGFIAAGGQLPERFLDRPQFRQGGSDALPRNSSGPRRSVSGNAPVKRRLSAARTAKSR